MKSIVDESEALWSRLLLSAQKGAPELPSLCQGALGSGWGPWSRRGFIVDPWTICPELLEGIWKVSNLPLRSLGLLDLCAFHDQPEVVDACLAAAPAPAWGSAAVSACAGLCAARGAWRSLEAIARHSEAAAVLFKSQGDPRDNMSCLLLGSSMLAHPPGRSALGALRRSAGDYAFGQWIKSLQGESWAARAIGRAWLGDASQRVWKKWEEQANNAALRAEPEALWLYAKNSAKAMDGLGLLSQFVAEAESAPAHARGWAGLSKAACACARPMDGWWTREWAFEAADQMAGSEEWGLRNSPAIGELRVMAERREIVHEIGPAGTGPRVPSARL